MQGHSYQNLVVGDKDFIEKTISETDVYMFAGITGDFNWLHINKVRAEKGRFKQRIVHGMLLVGLISNVIGNLMPGSGTIYEKQELHFLRPCFIDDTVRAEVEVLELLPAGRARLKTTCYNQDNEPLIDGEAIVIPPR